MAAPVHAPRLAEALAAARTGEPDAAERLAAVAGSGEEVLVPLGDDRRTPIALGDGTAPPHLVAFTSLQRVGWALPDGPPVAVVPLATVLGWVVRTGTEVRLDATSTDELRVDREAAAALVEGRTADLGGLLTGTRYEAPDAPAASNPPSLPAAPATATHAEPRYGRSWQPGAATPADPIDAIEARRRHDAGKPYVAVIERPGAAGPAVVEVAPDRVTVRFLDADGLDGLVYGYGRTDGDVLFGDLVQVGSAAEAERHVLRYAPDGTMRVWSRSATGAETSSDRAGVDVSRRWARFPAFGAYDGVLDVDR